MRHYMLKVAQSQVESRNAETALGKAWLIGDPLLFIAVYGTIFGVLLSADRGVDNFIGFLAAGQLLFRHNSQGMQTAGTAMRAYERQIQTMPLPRALFPIAAVFTTLFQQIPSFGVMVAIILATGGIPSLTWLLLPVVVGGQVLLNVGIGLIFARAIAHFPDLSNMLTHVFRALLYASGAVFPIAPFVEDRSYGDVVLDLLTVFNPIYSYVELGRWALMDIEPSRPALALASATAWPLISIAVGLWWLRRVEQRYGFGMIRNAP